MKVTLVRPPFYSILGRHISSYPFLRRGTFAEPLSLLYLGAVLDKHHYDVEIIDGEIIGNKILRNIWANVKHQRENLNEVMGNPYHRLWENMTKQILDTDPDSICFTTNTTAMTGVEYLCERLKSESDTQITLGGSHVSALPEQSLRDTGADIAVIGEGENVILDVVKSQADGRPMSGVVGRYIPIEDLDNIPFPARHLLPKGRYSRRIISTRGCPHRCIFCGSHAVWGRKVRFRSSVNIVQEAKMLYDEYGATSFRFNDDTFTINTKKAGRICSELKAFVPDISFSCNARIDTLGNEMIFWLGRANCDWVSLGIESGNQGVQANLNKGQNIDDVRRVVSKLKVRKVPTYLYFMINAPFETHQTLHDTVDLAKELDPDMVGVSMLTPMPGTDLWELYQKTDPKPRKWYEFYCQGYPVMSGELSPHRLYNEYLEMLNIFWWMTFKKRMGRILKRLRV